LLVFLAAPAAAERVELTALAGYTTKGDIDEKALGVQELALGDGFTWGASVGYFFSGRAGAELSWRRHESALEIGDAVSDAALFDIDKDVLQGSFVYRFGGADARLRPYLAAGIGATFFAADDLDGETKLSWSAGGGLAWLPAKKWGARLDARYAPTVLSDSDSAFCDPFGFCQGAFHQFELLGGLVFRP
jgi:opacity protein-like surface antigen